MSLNKESKKESQDQGVWDKLKNFQNYMSGQKAKLQLAEPKIVQCGINK